MNEALILCGGLGSRLKTAVPDRQKCAAAVDGTPFVAHVIRHAASFGFRRFVLCAGHLAETLVDTLDAAALGVELAISKEDSPLGTGGAIRQGAALIHGDAFLALNGDSLCPLDLAAFARFHRERGAKFSIALSHADARADCGNVALAPDGRVAAFNEKDGPKTGLVNAGVYLIDKIILGLFPRTAKFSLETEALPALIQAGGVFGFVTDAALLDIGTPERYRRAAATLKEMRLP